MVVRERMGEDADWIEALKLAAIGNIVYYLFLASAIQRAGGPLPTMIIGTLPVVIAGAAACGQLHRPCRGQHWRGAAAFHQG